MKNKILENEIPAGTGQGPLTNVTARQRWEMFHRAIAYAKQSNIDALDEDEALHADREPPAPYLSLVR